MPKNADHLLPPSHAAHRDNANRFRNVVIYSELYVAVAKRCLELENISITEYVNRALAKALNVPFRPRARRPYLPSSKLPLESVSTGIFSLLDLTPIGTPRKKGETP